MRAPTVKLPHMTAPAEKPLMSPGKKGKIPHPRLRARKLNIAGKSSYSGGKAPAFHPSGGVPDSGPAVANAGGIPGAGGQDAAFSPLPPDAAFQGNQ